MSGFDDLVQLENQSSSSNDYQVLAVMVDSYDLEHQPHSVLGRLVDDNGRPTDRLVRVFLREDPHAATREKPRTEIGDLADPRAMQHTTVGGVLFFNYVYPTNIAGTFSAWWVQSASHTPDEARVGRYWATVTFREMADNKVKCYVDYFKTHEAVKITDLSELAEVIANQLGGQSRPAFHRHSAVRLVDQRGRTVSVFASTQWVREETENWSSPCTGMESMEVFRQSNKWQAIENAFGAGEVRACEVIPGGRIYAGDRTRADIMRRPRTVQHYEDVYHDSQGHDLYVQTWLAVRKRPDGTGVFLTNIRPDGGNPMRYRLADIPSPYYEPPLERHVAPLPAGVAHAGAATGRQGIPSAGGDDPKPPTASYPGLPNQPTAAATHPPSAAGASTAAGHNTVQRSGMPRPFQIGADGPAEGPGGNSAAHQARPPRPPAPPPPPLAPVEQADGAEACTSLAPTTAPSVDVPADTGEQHECAPTPQDRAPDGEGFEPTAEDMAALEGPAGDDEFEISAEDMAAIDELAPRLP